MKPFKEYFTCCLQKMWHNIKIEIKNLIMWLPVIWNDRWWDDYYIYVILKKKLSIIEPKFRNEGHHVGNVATANKIKICINLLDRLIKNEYTENACKPHNRKWGEIKICSIQKHNDLSELIFTHENVKTEKDEEMQTKDRIKYSRHSEYMIEQDLDYLFKIIRKNIRCWWD